MTEPLLALLERIHQVEAEGILEDLLAPQRVCEADAVDQESHEAAMKEAWEVHRRARRDAERLLQRNSITARVAQDDEERKRLAAAGASKLGEFKRLRSLSERQARAKELVLPPSAQTITVAGSDALPPP